MITTDFTIGTEMLEKYNKCSICGCRKWLEPHHIIHVNKYDELYNSPDNVIILCHNCHHNYHQQYHTDINFHTLMEYKNNYDKQRIRKLQVDYNKLQKKFKALKEYTPFVLNRADDNQYIVYNHNHSIKFKSQSKAYECRNLLNTIMKEMKK